MRDPARSMRLSAFVLFSALIGLGAPGALAQEPAAPARAPATLTGVVRDSAGNGIPDVEVYLRETQHATRTNAQGEFTLAGVAPGSYRAFFRRLGFQSVEYNWAPSTGERTEVSVGLERIAQKLDPVRVRAEEDKRYAAHASIAGIVVDSAGYPIDEAEVQVVGANAAGMTRSNGGFLFKPLAIGSYVIRVRKLGYAPVTLTFELHQDDEREVYIRMHQLAHGLDPVVVNAESGYGNQREWDELERRRRWVDASSRILGPDQLKRFYEADLSIVARMSGMNVVDYTPRTPARFNPQAMAAPPPTYSWDGDACILLDGKTPIERPLDTFGADEVELLEIYPAYTELTGTVGSYFHSRHCAPTSILQHPTYIVIWLKRGAKAK
jgi:hypothetical protein